LRNFYNHDVNGGEPASDRVLEDRWNVAAGASPTGTLQCVDAGVEDVRQDIARNTVPPLIIHSDADRILPPDATADQDDRARQVRRNRWWSTLSVLDARRSRER
jgi:pimeloyl-ACP methyl ester carboxylesterase